MMSCLEMSGKRRNPHAKKGVQGFVKMEFLPYAEGREFCGLLGLKSQREWCEWSKSGQRPSNIPSHPDKVYRGKGWVSMMDFLGFEGKALGQKGDYLSFASAQAWVRQRNLKSKKEWQEFAP